MKRVQILSKLLVGCGMDEKVAQNTADSLYHDTYKAMYNAIVWGFKTFGPRATYNVSELKAAMEDGKLNEFQAQAKLVHKD